MNRARLEGPTRRELLAAGGALVVAFAVRPSEVAAATPQPEPAAKPAAPELPGSLGKQPLLDGWIRIDADGNVTLFTGKAELGQGIKTALLQIAAEELVVRPASHHDRDGRHRANRRRGLHRGQSLDAGQRHRDPPCCGAGSRDPARPRLAAAGRRV